MKCPYLSNASSKECVKMLSQNVEGELSEFDLQHFCDGNPVFCYYFRTPLLQEKRGLSPPAISLTQVTPEYYNKELLLKKGHKNSIDRDDSYTPTKPGNRLNAEDT